jgi:hypothetical protein
MAWGVPRMTVLFPSLPFARSLLGTERDAADAPERRALPASEPAAELAPDDAVQAEQDTGRVATRPGGGVVRMIGISVVVGTLTATAVLFAGRAWLAPPPREEIRLAQMAHATADLTDAQQAVTQKLRMLETEAVATGDSVTALDAKLQSQAAATATLQATVAKLAAEETASGRASLAVAALFGVAVVQLHDAVAAGRPFDWELVNLRGIVAGQPVLLAALDRLAPFAATGVASEAQLAEGLRALAQIDARRSGIPPLVGSGIELVGRVFGPVALPLPRNPTPELLTRASALLGDGDVAGSVRLLHSLDDATAEIARPLVAAADQRAAALAATQTLLQAAREGLRGQLKLAGKQP